jgi:hypothetical protein
MFGRLRGFAAAPAWEDELAAADLAHAGRVRARRRGVVGGVAAAAAVVAALLAVPAGPTSRDETPAGSVAARPAADSRSAEPSSSAPALSAADEAALVRAQASDGRWRSTTGDERHDAGATALAVLALANARASELRAGTAVPATRAVADGVRWLEARVADAAAAGDAASRRDRAVVATALVEVYAATREPALRAVVDRALQAVALDARDARTVDSSAAWSRDALARARAAGWRVPREAALSADERAPSTLASLGPVLAFVNASPAP